MLPPLTGPLKLLLIAITRMFTTRFVDDVYDELDYRLLG